jgi:uncharacterized hydrophobic protein (TIGR00271 family)
MANAVDILQGPGQRPLPDARQSLGPAVLDDLFPEGAAFRRSAQTFAVLLTLSGFIASFGLYQDSVAAIIGAMVVAPLGGAMMALAAALVTGRTRRQTITFAEIVLGSLGVVVIGWLVAFVMPQPFSLTPSLEARTHPGLLDLGVALAAGAAGAWVAVRRTGTDALPGVAIAVSLVPPLATAGICMELGRWDDAGGALLLFLTNFSAIVVVACIVFILAGARPHVADLMAGHRLRNGFVVAIVALVVVAIPLALNGFEVARRAILTTTGAPYVRAWVDTNGLQVVDWAIDGDAVTLRVTGPSQPPDPAPLAGELASAYGFPVELTVAYIPETTTTVTADP